MKNELIVGIDLGTTFSEVAWRTPAGVLELIPSIDGSLKYPSIVSFTKNPLAGIAASSDLIMAPEHTFRFFKRHMDCNSEQGKPFAVGCNADGEPITCVDCSAHTLKHIFESVEQYTGMPIKKAIIMAPAYFGEVGRANTKAAARIAGVEVVELLDEPGAAALHYCIEKNVSGTFCVIDIGGGTSDLTIVEANNSQIDIIAKDGDAELGGSNIDESISEFILAQARAAGHDVPEDDMAFANQVMDKAREAKELLSRRESITAAIDIKGQRFALELNREILKDLCCDFIERIKDLLEKIRQLIDDRSINLDGILWVGGSSRLPFLEPLVIDVLGQLPQLRDTDPDMVVAKGAAVYAHSVFGKDTDIMKLGDRKLLPSQIEMHTVSAHAICVAAIVSDRENDVEYNVPIVPANTPVPYDFNERFAPSRPDQNSVQVKIIEGSPGDLSSDCKQLFEINAPIKPNVNSSDSIIVKGHFSKEGVLDITVVDEFLGKEVTESFVHKTGLNEQEIKEKQNKLRKGMV